MIYLYLCLLCLSLYLPRHLNFSEFRCRWFKWPSLFLYAPDVLVSPGLRSTPQLPQLLEGWLLLGNLRSDAVCWTSEHIGWLRFHSLKPDGVCISSLQCCPLKLSHTAKLIIKMLLQQELPNRNLVFSWFHHLKQGHSAFHSALPRPSPISSAAQASILRTKASAKQQRRMTWRSAERSNVPSRWLANSS